jgi:hypothetical protein
MSARRMNAIGTMECLRWGVCCLKPTVLPSSPCKGGVGQEALSGVPRARGSGGKRLQPVPLRRLMEHGPSRHRPRAMGFSGPLSGLPRERIHSPRSLDPGFFRAGGGGRGPSGRISLGGNAMKRPLGHVQGVPASRTACVPAERFWAKCPGSWVLSCRFSPYFFVQVGLGHYCSPDLWIRSVHCHACGWIRRFGVAGRVAPPLQFPGRNVYRTPDSVASRSTGQVTPSGPRRERTPRSPTPANRREPLSQSKEEIAHHDELHPQLRS